MLLGLTAAVFAVTAAWAGPPETFVDRPSGLQKRLLDGAFDELDAIAAGYIKSRARERGGDWAIIDFYDILARYDITSGPCQVKWGASFDEKRAAMERWIAAKPESATAKIALANLWERYAWTGRGCGYADETSDAQWQAFHERLGRAHDLLKTVDHNADPQPYLTEMRVAERDGDVKQEQAHLYEWASRAFPTVPNYATTRYYFLLPRWGGAEGEAGAFAKSLLAEPGGETGLELYFDVARTALTSERPYDTLLKVTGIDYPTLVKAFAARLAVFGPSTSDMNVLLYYALAARDLKTADFLTKKIGKDWERDYWRDQATYDSLLTWIRQWLLISSLMPR